MLAAHIETGSLDKAVLPVNLIKPTSSLKLIVAMHADPVVVAARQSAHSGFAGRYRKLPKDYDSTPLPYVVHLEEVVDMLIRFGYGAEVVAGGYLHDHLEDLKGWDFKRMQDTFGSNVANLVSWVTQQNKGLGWEERQRLYAERLKDAPDEALAISLADKFSNVRSLLFWMQRGFKVEEIIFRGWEVNSKKFHQLLELYETRLPVRMVNQFRQLLKAYDYLGKK